MIFDDIECVRDQEFDATNDSNGTIEYPVKTTTFLNIRHLTIHCTTQAEEEGLEVLLKLLQ